MMIENIHFEKSITDNANNIYIVDSETGKEYSYRESIGIALKVGSKCKALSVLHSDKVALFMTNSVEMAVCYLACLYYGYTVVPINPATPQKEIDFIVSTANVKLIILNSDTLNTYKNLGILSTAPRSLMLTVKPGKFDNPKSDDQIEYFNVDPDQIGNHALDYKPLIADADIASINFTSGTTGNPKGVMHTFGGLINNARAFNCLQQLGSHNRFIHVFPMAYMAGYLNTLLSPLLAGSSVLISRQFSATSIITFWKDVIKHQVNTMWLAPTMAAGLTIGDRGISGTDYCKTTQPLIFVGTAPLPSKTKENFEEKYGVTLYESYGLSELLYVTANSPRFENRNHSVGIPLNGVVIKILDEFGVEVASNVEGEVFVNTSYSMKGYLEEQPKGIECVSSTLDWFPTGDYGSIDEEGYLYITGRKKDLIIKGGINISPRAVEEVISNHEHVNEVAVIGMPHSFYGEQVIAVVNFLENGSLEDHKESLSQLCRSTLADHSLPSSFIEINEIPKNNVGKIQKNVLKKLLSQRFKNTDLYIS